MRKIFGLILGVCILLVSTTGCYSLNPVGDIADSKSVAQNKLEASTLSDSDKGVVQKAIDLFDAGDYEKAAELYEIFDLKKTEYEIISEIVYNQGVELFESENYDYCDLFLSMISDYNDSKYYRYISQAYINYVDEREVNYLEITQQLQLYSEAGVEIATEALEKVPFQKYSELLSHSGFYRSCHPFTKQDPFSKYEMYTYINLDTDLVSQAYAKDAIVKITPQKVINKAEQSKFTCSCLYDEEVDKFHCMAYYNDLFDGTRYRIFFDMFFENDDFVIESVVTTEDKGQESITADRYTKIS